MFQIDESVIRNYSNDIVYKRGLDYYKMNKVVSLEVVNNIGGPALAKITSLRALVKSSYDWEYKVEINYNRNGFTSFHCDCEAFQNNFGRFAMCKHLVAALLKYTRGKVDIKKNRDETKVDEIVGILKAAMVEKSLVRKELKLEIRYEYQYEGQGRYTSVELKIGEDKCYVVKNMREFLKTIRNKNESLEFGKNFTYNPFKYNFAQCDESILNLLMEVYEADMPTSGLNYYYKNSSKFLSGKKAYLSDFQVKRFFSILSDSTRKFEGIIQGTQYSQLSVLKEDMPLEFDLKLEDDKIVINHTGADLPISLTYDGDYFFYKGSIYKPSEKQLSIYVPVYNELIKRNSVLKALNKKDMEKIASVIIPSLKKISKKINVQGEIDKDFQEEPLIPKLYFDSSNSIITCEVHFNYGDIIINPLHQEKENRENVILIRDIEGEEKIKDVIKNFGFKASTLKYQLEDENEIVVLLTEGITKLQELSEIYYSDSFKGLKIYNPSSFKSSIKLRDNNFLEFSFNIDGVDKDELKNIFLALKDKKRYYKLKKGGFVSLETRELMEVANILDYMDVKHSELDNDNILIPKYNAAYIDNKLKASNLDFIEKNRSFREMVSNIQDVKSSDFVVPEFLAHVLRNYQKTGYKWLSTLANYGFGGILADEMGLGKTIQAITFIAAVEENIPSLVITPTSLVYNWKSEIERFAPMLKTLAISGSRAEREKLISMTQDYDIVVTSYPLIRRDIDKYKEISFKYCFLDEAQQIKNPSSINARSVKQIKAESYFALTGTPIENSLTELWSIFDFIMPGYLLNHNKFMEKYESPIIKNGEQKALEELKRHVQPFILRRLKKDVIKELPPKIEVKLTAELTLGQKKLYAAYLSAAKGEIAEEIKDKGFNKSRLKILAVLTRLRQICLDPSIFIEDYKGESGKMLLLDDILEESIEGGHRILLFSQFTSVLKKIGERLTSRGTDFMYLDGKTKIEERGKLVSDFNSGTSKVFLISLKAGGTGLNLTGADVVIHFDPWWNPAVEDQASDRAHRIGQLKTVEVIKLITSGTIEEKIYELQEKKKDIINSVMEGNNNEESFLAGISPQELQELFMDN